jgi:hypothetical protein
MAQQSDDLAILSRAFEDALTDLLLEVFDGGWNIFRPANEATAGPKPLAPPHGLYRKGRQNKAPRRLSGPLGALRARHRLSVLRLQRYELAAPHSITSSARASSLGALEDASGMCAALNIRNAGSVAHPPGSLGS